MTITVAAIIPLYNGAPFIIEALRSVVAQTDPPDEVIVVDDGSTDEGPALVEEFARNHRITILRKPNGGQSSARNTAIMHTNCSHIALLDQDDAWYDNHLAVLKAPFESPPVRDLAFVYGNLDQIDREGRMVAHCVLDAVPSPQPKRSLQDCLSYDQFILPGASLIAKDAMVAVGLFDERLSGYEDDDLFLRLFMAGYRSVYVNEAVTRWRIYAGSTSFSARMAKSRMIYFHKLIELFPDDPRLGVYWRRNFIAPRFFEIAYNEFYNGSKNGEAARLAHGWTAMLEIVPYMKNRVRRRMNWVAPVVGRIYRGRLTGVARRLVRFAARA
ncbi:glycosyltransferase family 2 protein [Rhodoblastus acidophilus]|uniref:Glycosyltransferase family 2 protein n=1 Tax=Candidatus Rhodoblastus alkanivorans TaxID=2954117 RepID=A0ABS9Z4G9_9HYPH|nr:glycosyltransferase family A protein [Candidatus Rhodoblastus alkanivorans]MCI4677694.1 glycosyltransferase family 2 protein [Candidatus Rhodoblastus alkanivorans]MCI4682574.1 glycosyltransferase family 2 protein [Candidatus Rhodoblastus alkanivorans]MDI4639880.1 glycosyltransferase family 2 protein [Rhodoblastus acidophilus]